MEEGSEKLQPPRFRMRNQVKIKIPVLKPTTREVKSTESYINYTTNEGFNIEVKSGGRTRRPSIV